MEPRSRASSPRQLCAVASARPYTRARGFQCHDLGWADLKNGALLDAMAGRFDVLITVDRSVPYQQRIHDRPLTGAILRARSNRLVDLLPLIPALLRVLDDVKPGEVREIWT